MGLFRNRNRRRLVQRAPTKYLGTASAGGGSSSVATTTTTTSSPPSFGAKELGYAATTGLETTTTITTTETIKTTAADPANIKKPQNSVVPTRPQQQPSTNNTAAARTPPGHNKRLRDTARWFLMGYALCMFAGMPHGSIICSACALCTLLQGTFWSFKNWLWGVLVFASLPASVFATLWHAIGQGMMFDSGGTCDNVCMFFWIIERAMEVYFGGVCCFVLLETLRIQKQQQ